ncbi:hypothetical protein [uncultured Mediterranean phage uvMED]|nr:hypothetical protein [uncultured phage MedDCM-OCT-S11-C178]ADD95683.1 hypothetical protein [uncultured phage MedDCM-OCT-S12-C97]BAQ92038.1 hypothetical protein [uncultured Mediterranean phage uvMED]BAQ92131.1 hypothetical protein [uncultured Mediterranean phage uvMED]BAQ92234.1 hypothetical protein [uncultured Mediterranean phage uvMED]|tara:strand:- start:367 stop:600 length:234 start_codon:yes stop_codon:yes gene_type:complete
MKAIIEKQILEWKEELAKQIKTKDQAEKVLADANRTILMIEGGIQAQVNLLQKIESESQQSGTVDLTKSPKQARSSS